MSKDSLVRHTSYEIKHSFKDFSYPTPIRHTTGQHKILSLSQEIKEHSDEEKEKESSIFKGRESLSVTDSSN